MTCEREHAVADEVGRGLVARNHQHTQHVTSFHRADRITRVYLPRERAHRIGLARLHPVGQQRFEVASDLGACAVSVMVSPSASSLTLVKALAATLRRRICSGGSTRRML